MTGGAAEAEPQPQASEAEFEQLVASAFNLQRGGQEEEALALARRAEAIASRLAGPTSSKIAHAHNLLGVVFYQMGYFRDALQAYERALAAAKGLDGGTETLLRLLHNNFGQAYERLEQLDQAQAHLETAVTKWRAAGDESKGFGFALDNLGSIRGRRGDLAAAETIHQEALAIFRRVGGPLDPDMAVALGNLSKIYSKRRDFERAEAYRLRALDAHHRTSGPTGGATLEDVACLIHIYWDSGDEARADALINHLLSLGRGTPSPGHRNLAEALRKLLKAALYNFRLDVAERLGSRVIELLAATEGPDAPETLRALRELANVHRGAGNREAAEDAYHQAWSGYARRRMPHEAAAVVIDLSKLYRDAGSYETAEGVLRAVLDQLRRTPERDSKEIASALGNLGLVHYEAEDYEAADFAFLEALGEVERDPEKASLERPWLLHNRAMLKYHIGDYASAVDLYMEAKELWTDLHGPDHPFVAICAANLALVHWAMGKNDSALSFFSEAEALGDHDMQRVLAVGSERQRAAYARERLSELHKVVSFCPASGLGAGSIARFAAQMLLRRKGRVLDAIAHTLTRVRESAEAEDQLLITRLQAVREEMAELTAPMLITRRPADEVQRLRRLRAEEERLERALSHRGALHRPGMDPVTLDQVQHRLDPDHALIDLLRFVEFDPARTGTKRPWKEARYGAMVLRRSGDPQWFDLGPASAIETRTDRWRSLLRNFRSDIAELHALGAELYRILVEPLLEAVDGASRLLVSPDGKLALIPFGALRTPDDRYLKERCGVSYLSSGRELARLTESEPQSRDIVIFAAPDFDFDAADPVSAAAAKLNEAGDFAPLPETEKEANEISALFENVSVVKGRWATAQRLSEIRRPLVLHAATHGIFSALREEETSRRNDLLTIGGVFAEVESVSRSAIVNPMFCSGLVLAGANHRGRGVLTAQEIAGLDLRGTRLAVLSACETGLGTVKAGEEFAGLRRALAIAGSQTQVTSLWRVDDAATRTLMTEYYRLLSAGKGRADALELAQTRLADEYPRWRHPAYWAAFISAGAYDAIDDLLPRREDTTQQRPALLAT